MTGASNPVPRVYALLAESRNVAADRALVAALPELPADYREAALDTVLRRDRARGLAEVVARFPAFDASLQELVLAHADRLSAGIRVAIDAEDLDARLAAIELICRSGSSKLAYLLAGAIAQRCPRTRERAGKALQQLVADYLRRRGAASAGHADPMIDRQGRQLALSIRQALGCWEAHFRTEIVTAAMWLADKLEDIILTRVSQARSKLGYAFNELLRGGYDTRTAGYLLRALRSPVLRSKAARWIGACKDDDMMKALLDEAWVIGDPEMCKALSWIRRLGWLEGGIHPLLGLDARRAEAAASFVGAIGIGNNVKVSLFQQMAASGSLALARAGLWQLAADPSEEAATALRRVAKRGDGSLARVANHELKWRSRAGLAQSALVTAPGATSTESALNTFSAYWLAFDRLDETRQVEFTRTLRAKLPDFERQVRGRLTGGDPADRVRAVLMVRAAAMAPEVDTQLYALAHDADSMVRSVAIRALEGLDTPTSRRLLRNALSDRDERVQANAIEALDTLEAAQFSDEIKEKLDSPSPRVRANAVKSLLKLELREAVDALLAMLDGESRADRLSALWVVECLQLQSLTDRLAELARDDPDPQVRHRAAQVAEKVGVVIPVTEPVAASETAAP